MVNDKILIARENRRKKVKIIAEKTSAVTLKANIPGDDKNLPEVYLIVNYFIKKVMALGAKFIEIEDSQDGVTVYFSAEDGKKIKNLQIFANKCLQFEKKCVIMVSQANICTILC